MAAPAPTQGNRNSHANKDDFKLSPEDQAKFDSMHKAAEEAEFNELAARLKNTPAGDSDQPHIAAGNSPYDTEQPRAASQAHSSARAGGTAGGTTTLAPEDIQQAESAPQPTHENQLGRGYTSGGNSGGNNGGGPSSNTNNGEPEGERRGFFGAAGSRFKQGFKKRRRMFIFGGGAIGVLVGIIIGIFSILPFQLNTILENVRLPAFGRLHSNILGNRSHKYIIAYLTARLMDIEDGTNPNNKTTDNVLFRATAVDTGRFFLDWYRTVRATKFESDLFDAQGIKFSAIAVRSGNVISTKPARITINDKVAFEVNLRDLGINEDVIRRAVDLGDVTALEEIDRATGRLSELIQIEVFDSNSEGRRELRNAMRNSIDGNGFKRWVLSSLRGGTRRAIMNMTGIAPWKPFEQTRDAAKKRVLSMINTVIDKSMPANMRSAQLMRCILGIISCRASPDQAHPSNRNLPPDGSRETRRDSQGNPVGDGSDTASGGLGPSTPEIDDVTKKIAQKILKGAGLVLNIVSLMDSLANFHNTVNSRALSILVENGRIQQLIALFAFFGAANDQLRTGEVADQEINEFMALVSNATNNEGWSTLVDGRPNVVYAQDTNAIYEEATNKAQFCSPEHQEKFHKPINRPASIKEFVYRCISIGGASLALSLEQSYMAGIGKIVAPLATVWQNSLGLISAFFNSIVDAITGPIMEGIIALLGLTDDVVEFMAWLTGKVAEFAGALPMLTPYSLPGEIINLLFMGASATAETVSRIIAGAAVTTPESRAAAIERYAVFMEEQRNQMSLYERYLALDNPRSTATIALFKLINQPPGSIGSMVFGAMGSIFTAPLSIVSKTANAATLEEPYAAANFAEMRYTYDHPTECLDANPLKMTPASSTNADELGIIPANELNWELLTNSDNWYNKLYEKQPDENIVLKVWNCGLADDFVAGSMGRQYGAPGKNTTGGTITREQ